MPRPAPLIFASLAAFLLLAEFPSSARAFIFCPVGPQSFAEEMADMDVAVIVTLVELPPDPGPEIPGVEPEVPRAQFEIVRVLKGDKLVKPEQRIEAVYSGDGKPGDRFLLMGVNDPPLLWSTPMAMTVRSEAYVCQLPKLPADGKERMRFFYSFLQDPDEMLARDALDELSKFDYSQLVELKDELAHDQLIAGIKDKGVPANYRRFYLKLLSICGNKEDVPLLEGIMLSKNKNERAGLDAAIACYLTLQGTAGLKLVEERFLKNKRADYADTYSAVMALRSSETGIPQHRRLQALRLMLDRPDLADLVIPDLVRMEDWHQADRLFGMFKESVVADQEAKKSWVRVPIINYLRACPLPKARELLLECEKLDPAAVERAKKMLPEVIPKPQKFAGGGFFSVLALSMS